MHCLLLRRVSRHRFPHQPGLKLKASEEAELLGMHDDQLGEFAYDYVEVRRDYLAWAPEHGSEGMKEMDSTRVQSPTSQSQLIEGRGGDIEMVGVVVPYEGPIGLVK